MMAEGEVKFYQVAGEGPGAVDAVLPKLLAKALEAGERLVVVCPTAARVGRVDESLWTFDAGSFLPHGASGCAFAEVQPIMVIAAEDTLPEGRMPVVLAGAEEALRQAVAGGTAKVAYLFDSAAPVVDRARGLWKEIKGRAEVRYLAQTEGRWVAKGA